MRKSIHDYDHMNWEVYLNDQKEPLCIYADDEAGIILTHVYDSEGRIVGDGGGCFYRLKRGKVQLKQVNCFKDTVDR